MKYKLIIEEMKEGNDPNVMAFLKDVERMKPLTKKEKDYYLQTRFLPSSIKRLVEDFIPYIILVAYYYKDKTKTLQMLDLINEGILGAYAAFEKSTKGGLLTKKRVQENIKKYIRNAVRRDLSQSMADYTFDVCMPEGPMNDEGEVLDIDRGAVRRVLMDMLEKSLGARDANIIYDYYLDQEASYKRLGVKYGVNGERCRQVVKKVTSRSYAEIKQLKQNL